jgi:hypothetical protein
MILTLALSILAVCLLACAIMFLLIAPMVTLAQLILASMAKVATMYQWIVMMETHVPPIPVVWEFAKTLLLLLDV